MKKIILFGILISLMLQIGCTKPNNEITKDSMEDSVIMEVGGVDKEILTRSERIADSVVELFGIDDSVSIVFNDIAVVGIVLSYDKELDGELKEDIVNRIKETDPQIKEVNITKTEKNVEQLNEIIIGLLNGNPYDNYVEEINNIIEKVKKEK